MLNKTLRFLHLLEDSALILLVLGMLFLTLGQIVLRNTGFSGFLWAETAIRVLVLWLAMFGAMRASRQRNHIAIDILSHYGNELTQRIAHFAVSLFAASVCLIAAYYSAKFVQLEMEYPTEAFLNIPTWVCEAIIPFSLFIIGIRFIFHSLNLPQQLEHDA